VRACRHHGRRVRVRCRVLHACAPRATILPRTIFFAACVARGSRCAPRACRHACTAPCAACCPQRGGQWPSAAVHTRAWHSGRRRCRYGQRVTLCKVRQVAQARGRRQRAACSPNGSVQRSACRCNGNTPPCSACGTRTGRRTKCSKTTTSIATTEAARQRNAPQACQSGVKCAQRG